MESSFVVCIYSLVAGAAACLLRLFSKYIAFNWGGFDLIFRLINVFMVVGIFIAFLGELFIIIYYKQNCECFLFITFNLYVYNDSFINLVVWILIAAFTWEGFKVTDECV